MAMTELKKGDSVILKGFTGIKLGVFPITAASKKTLTITKANGDELVFDRKSGKQINVAEGKERYANSIMEDDGSYVKPNTSKKKKPAKKAKPAAKPAVEEDEEEDVESEEEEAEEAPKKSSKKSTKKSSKKPVEVEPEEEDEEDEEDDEEYEEVDE